jgi:hypothetical protein
LLDVGFVCGNGGLDDAEFDDVGERHSEFSRADEVSFKSQVCMLRTKERRGDTGNFGGVGYSTEEDGAVERGFV